MSSANQGKLPGTDYKLIDGILYQGGVKIFVEQLTEAELKEHWPEKWKEQYGLNMKPCPVCGHEVKADNKRGIFKHFDNAHPERMRWFKKHSERHDNVEKLFEALTKSLKEIEKAHPLADPDPEDKE